MLTRRTEKSRDDCAIITCEGKAYIRGLCHACYSWWRHHRNQTASEAREYIYRTKRIAARVPVLIGARKEQNPHWERPDAAPAPTLSPKLSSTPKVRQLRRAG